ncbi:glycosyltransferase family 2 protein [Paracoccus aminophilus]|uniref:Glycosyl transferase family 2 n=1 Tax=Paracoccus aminophilus JCM 7686 TaxID=1367847 RepID=S5YF43_PARAH|nr:glycosyltransferase family 2 protein [Paracoccus aminophilus]AGT10068.1 glycosyl transferase family 2 [Paracoccus aminophilus JCM 7686]
MTAPEAGAAEQDPPRLSIVIVSRHRRDRLSFCLAALEQQDHPAFEVILVADPGSVDLRPDLALKRIPFDEANISAARNAGIAAAGAEIIAFIDDDALALPSWASRLARAFTDPRVIAATGWTRGPDGFRWQARGERIGADGLAFAIAESGALGVANGAPVSTLGTNCAFRRAALREIGGFDPAFAYHLDESDVNLRLARRFPQALTAVLSRAEVIHGAAAGPVRAQSGVPSDLTAIGRSTAIFVARHGGEMPDLAGRQRKRLLRLMVAGRLDPLGVAPLLAGLARGIEAGQNCPPPAPPVAIGTDSHETLPFLPFGPRIPRRVAPQVFSGWHWQARALRRSAAQAVAAGGIAGVILWSPGFLPPRLGLHAGGWWEQKGGIWAGFGENQPLFAGRKAAERALVRRLSSDEGYLTEKAGGTKSDEYNQTYH